MASVAAATTEKGSPVVVGLLVVGNIIILVRHPLGAQWAGEEEGVVLNLGAVWLRAQDPLNGPCLLASQVRRVPIWIPALPLPSCVNLSKQLEFSVPASPSIDYVFTVGTVESINPQSNGPQIRKSA